MPKDSLAIIELGKDSVLKIASVKTFKAPEKAAGWVAYHLEKERPDSSRKKVADSLTLKNDLLAKLADSIIRKSIDSVKGRIEREEVIEAARKAAKEILKKGGDYSQESDADEDAVPGPKITRAQTLSCGGIHGNKNEIYSGQRIYFVKGPAIDWNIADAKIPIVRHCCCGWLQSAIRYG